ncbi:MAG TPA: DsbA family protein [Solirubrobacterales bacterium]|nr:DsbA family protein [Solirubrobacterales bacterium]
MAGGDVELYFDLGSPYAHLAVARAERVLGRPPVLRPVLLGAIFQARGFGSWSQSAQREGRIAELEARAERYGLPPFAWPPGWPLDGLAAMRACVWAEERGALDRFVHAAFEHEFGRGEDISGVTALAAIATEVGLPGAELQAAVASAPVKARLRELTAEAWERGVRGIPTIAVGATLIYGDDQLEQVPLLLAD